MENNPTINIYDVLLTYRLFYMNKKNVNSYIRVMKPVKIILNFFLDGKLFESFLLFIKTKWNTETRFIHIWFVKVLTQRSKYHNFLIKYYHWPGALLNLLIRLVSLSHTVNIHEYFHLYIEHAWQNVYLQALKKYNTFFTIKPHPNAITLEIDRTYILKCLLNIIGYLNEICTF